ncbi:het domain-containing protein [Fusarium heterosporum]|uniref:Het domain-containing protein n=1 Tax=Fusarium heterosporum TaxID=42747 RepID=A0A8H5TP47_FUSHE|nr:het domain-containing protein [Fusarium heterosporum]
MCCVDETHNVELTEAINSMFERHGISQDILQDKHLLTEVPVSHRMSWVASRHTTRPEDIAYCLIGIFNVKTGFFYGEGRKSAFFRLQEEMIRRTNDMSIFAWRSLSTNEKYRGVLALGPEEFVDGSLYRQATSALHTPEFIITNKGVRINTGLHYTKTGDSILYLHHSKEGQDNDLVGVYLKAYSGGIYARMKPNELATIAKPGRGRPAQRYLI